MMTAIDRAMETAIEALNVQANRMREYADKLDGYVKAMMDDQTKEKYPVAASTRMTWAINEIENFIRNVSFSSMARVCAELRVEEMEKPE